MRTPWQSRPAFGAQIDWGRPQAHGLAFCAAFNEAGRDLHDLVTGKTGTATSGVTRGVYRFDGPGVSYAATTDNHDFTAFAGPQIPAGNFSVVYRGRWKAGDYRTAGTGGAKCADYFAWGSTPTNANFTLRGVADTDSGIALTDGNFYSIGIAYKRLVEARFVVLNLTNQTLTRTTVANTATPTITTALKCYIGARNNAGAPDYGWNDQLTFTALWGRMLSDLELLALVYNPWSLFLSAPSFNPMFVPGVAAGGGASSRRPLLPRTFTRSRVLRPHRLRT